MVETDYSKARLKFPIDGSSIGSEITRAESLLDELGNEVSVLRANTYETRKSGETKLSLVLDFNADGIVTMGEIKEQVADTFGCDESEVSLEIN